MRKIQIEQLAHEPWEFSVTIREGESLHEYMVTMTEEEYERYGGDLAPLELIKATFNFLLAHEELEEIIDNFSLSEIEKEFPEYPEVIEDYSD